MTSVLSVTVHFDELCIVAWDADYRHENMVGGSCAAQALCTVQASWGRLGSSSVVISST